MKKRIEFNTYSINQTKTIDESYNGYAVVKKDNDKTVVSFTNKDKITTLIHIYNDQVIIKRDSVTSGVISLRLDQVTTYDLKTGYGVMNFEIETFELLIKEDKVVARYYILPDKTTIHEVSICL